MDVMNIFGLLAVVVANAAAILITHIKQKKERGRTLGIINGRGDLFQQVGRLQDDMVNIREDLAELKGIMKVYLAETGIKL
jgi:hypothetical protein